jgi:hypothetical protein
VPETSVTSDFKQSLDVFSEFGFKDVGGHLKILSFLVIPLSIEEPSWNSVSFGVVDDTCDSITLGLVKLTGSKSWVESQNFTDEETESSADSLDFIESERDGSFTVDVCVEDTMDVLESVLGVLDYQRHAWWIIINDYLIKY